MDLSMVLCLSITVFTADSLSSGDLYFLQQIDTLKQIILWAIDKINSNKLLKTVFAKGVILDVSN